MQSGDKTYLVGSFRDVNSFCRNDRDSSLAALLKSHISESTLDIIFILDEDLHLSIPTINGTVWICKGRAFG